MEPNKQEFAKSNPEPLKKSEPPPKPEPKTIFEGKSQMWSSQMPERLNHRASELKLNLKKEEMEAVKKVLPKDGIIDPHAIETLNQKLTWDVKRLQEAGKLEEAKAMEKARKNLERLTGIDQ